MSGVKVPFDVSNHYFVLRVALDEIKPPIWRRIVTPASIPLDLLHDVLQVTMGWEDYHLHQFTLGSRRFTEFTDDDNHDDPDIGEDERGMVLGQFISRPRQKFTYTYDFGDGWRHTITLEKVEAIPAGHAVRIHCQTGRRSCPPEDVGGPWGYASYLEALGDPRHEEHKDMLRWRGEFDPEAFDVDEINQRLAWLIRWSRPRKR